MRDITRRKAKPPRYEVTPEQGGTFGVWDNGLSAYAVRGCATEGAAALTCSRLNADEYKRLADVALRRLMRSYRR